MEIDAFLQDLGQPWRRVGDQAWGLTLDDVGGWPLDVGLAVRKPAPELLAIQAPVCRAGQLDPRELLHRSRRLVLVRFTATRAGEVWLQGELPWPVASPGLLSTTLAVLVGAAEDARLAASGRGV